MIAIILVCMFDEIIIFCGAMAALGKGASYTSYYIMQQTRI